jgi:hypothetical protein
MFEPWAAPAPVSLEEEEPFEKPSVSDDATAAQCRIIC